MYRCMSTHKLKLVCKCLLVSCTTGYSSGYADYLNARPTDQDRNGNRLRQWWKEWVLALGINTLFLPRKLSLI